MPPIPAPHLVLRDFLAPGEHQELLDWALANEPHYVAATVNGGRVDPTVRQCQKLQDLGPSRAIFKQRLAAEHAEWLKQLRVSTFALDYISLEIAAYGDGAHFRFHMDTGRAGGDGRSHTRRITGVYYFFQEPRQFSGGDILLYALGSGPGSADYVSFAPEQNTLLVFPSWVGHEVTPIRCPTNQFAHSRFAVNCWLHQPAPDGSAANKPSAPAAV